MFLVKRAGWLGNFLFHFFVPPPDSCSDSAKTPGNQDQLSCKEIKREPRKI